MLSLQTKYQTLRKKEKKTNFYLENLFGQEILIMRQFDSANTTISFASRLVRFFFFLFGGRGCWDKVTGRAEAEAGTELM